MAKPFGLSEDLESLRKSWDFNIKNRMGKVNIERSFDLLVESLRTGNRDHFATPLLHMHAKNNLNPIRNI